MSSRVLVAAGLLLGAMTAGAEEFTTFLRPIQPPPGANAGLLPLPEEDVAMEYAFQTRPGYWMPRRVNTADVHEIKTYDQRFSVAWKIPISNGLSIAHRVSSGSKMVLSPGERGRMLLLTRESATVAWQQSDKLRLFLVGGFSDLNPGRRMRGETGMNFGWGCELVLFEGVTLSGEWNGDRFLGNEGSFAATTSTGVDIAIPRLPASLHVGYWRLDQTFEAAPGAPYTMSGFDASVTWEVNAATAVTFGYQTSQDADTSSRTAGNYHACYAELSLRAGRFLECTIQAARGNGTSLGQGPASFPADYVENSLHFGVKVRGSDGFQTEIGTRLRQSTAAAGSSAQTPLFLLSARMLF